MISKRKLNLNFKILLVVLGVSGLFELVLVNNSCMAGSRLSRLEREKSVLLSDINSLNNRLSQKKSLGEISDSARNLGLVDFKGSEVKFIGSPEVARVTTDATP